MRPTPSSAAHRMGEGGGCVRAWWPWTRVVTGRGWRRLYRLGALEDERESVVAPAVAAGGAP